MATARTGIDGLGIYLTNADAQGAAQPNADLSIGGYRSSTELARLGYRVERSIGPLRIDWLSGANGTGVGRLGANGSTAYWQPYGESVGASVAIADGETKLLVSADTDKAVRITRDRATDLGGEMRLDCKLAFNTALGLDNVSSAERAAGHISYRALMLRAHGLLDVTSIAIWVGTLGTQCVTGAGQLGASGAGTIETAGTFADWPDAGWAHVLNNAGATREIVYYTSRTATVLTVPAGGRGLLGTAADAGAATDTVDAVPGIQIGWEAPSSNAIQTIANDTTDPAGLTFDTGITAATGLTHATLARNEEVGLWIRREIPAVAVASAKVENKINVQFVYDGATYNDTIHSYYRIADSALALYELYVGQNQSPDYTAAPATTSATLPMSYALTPPTVGTRVFHLVCRKRNQYGLLSYNTFERTIEIDSTGARVTRKPTAPTFTAVETDGGYIFLRAEYPASHDAVPATHFRYYVRGDETNPIPGTDTPVAVPMERNLNLFARPQMILHKSLGPHPANAEIRILVTSYRDTDGGESINTTPVTVTIATQVPARPIYGKAGHGDSYMQEHALPLLAATTVYIDQPNNVRWIMGDGYVDLYGDTVWIWRLRYNSARGENNGLWTTFGTELGAVLTGAPAATPVEVISWTAGDKRIGFSVNGVRRMVVDVTNSKISATGMPQNLDVIQGNASDAAYETDWHALFQVYDPTQAEYETAMSLDFNGVLRRHANVPWKQVVNTSEIP